MSIVHCTLFIEMNLSGLLPLLDASPEFQALLTRLQSAPRVTAPIEVLDAARPYVLSALQEHFTRGDSSRPIVVVSARTERAKQLWTDITSWSAQPERIFYFAEPDPLIYERMPWSVETIALRLAALSALSGKQTGDGVRQPPPFIVTTIRALMTRTAPPEEFQRGVVVLERG
ncbi:MAG TPA: hypothetical protein VFD70_23600, partial [Anaerolineae bacterium]|nr:hypothetical protein [Anaerolineae bacterium]